MNYTYPQLCEARWLKLKNNQAKRVPIFGGAQVGVQPLLIYELRYDLTTSNPSGEYPVLIPLVHNEISCYAYHRWLEPAFSCGSPTREEIAMIEMLGYILPEELK